VFRDLIDAASIASSVNPSITPLEVDALVRVPVDAWRVAPMSLIAVVEDGFLKLLTVNLTVVYGLVTAKINLAVDAVTVQELNVIPIVCYRRINQIVILTEVQVGVVNVLKVPRVGKFISTMSLSLNVVGVVTLRVKERTESAPTVLGF
jgi:hypothetical protein